MRAIVFRGVGKGAKLEEREVPSIKEPTDVLIKVKIAGICGSDIAILDGRHPATEGVILGHEYAGEVAEVGEMVSGLRPGDRVVVDPNLKCGCCYYCRTGRENQCENFTTLGIYLDGGFAEYNLAPERAVYKLPEAMRWKDAVLVEPTSCVVNGIARAGIKAGDTVLIIGAGPMGLIWTQLAKARARRVIVSDLRDKRLELAKALGADVTLNPARENLLERVREVTDGRMADVAVEAVGDPKTVEEAIECVGYGGTVVVFGTVKQGLRVPLKAYELMRHEKRIVGSFIANYTFQTAVDLMQSRAVDADRLITHEFKLGEFEKALEAYRSGEAIKITLLSY